MELTAAMTPLSVVIITFNEEKNIARCIDSVKAIADEIVVVDSFSTDNTKKICLEKNVHFVEHAFQGHIEQKNWAKSVAKHPFVLSLDADEVLSEELSTSIIEAKNNTLADGYTMNRLTNYCGQWIRHCGWYPDTKLRLWNSTMGKWGGQNPHDKFEMQKDAKILKLKGDLLHYSYYSIEDHIKQIDKFTAISSSDLANKGYCPSTIKLLFCGPVKFFRDYFFKLGILDGYAGFQISKMSAFATYLKYARARDKYRMNRSKMEAL